MNRSDQPARINRRGFLKKSGAIAGVVALWAGGILPLLALIRQRAIADLHFADFAALVGQPFGLYPDQAPASTVHLIAVKDRTRSTVQFTSPRQECFSLVFCGPKGQALVQGTYHFAHPQLGHFELFVVPAQPVGHEERYIGIINRI